MISESYIYLTTCNAPHLYELILYSIYLRMKNSFKSSKFLTKHANLLKLIYYEKNSINT